MAPLEYEVRYTNNLGDVESIEKGKVGMNARLKIANEVTLAGEYDGGEVTFADPSRYSDPEIRSVRQGVSIKLISTHRQITVKGV